MKKNMLKVAVALIALIMIPTAIVLTNELQKDDLNASAGGMKTTIETYEKIMVGGQSYTALTPTSFLVDKGIGTGGASTPMSWADALDNVAYYIPGTPASTKEKKPSFMLSAKFPSKADLPIESGVLNSSIPNNDINWWLNDEFVGEGSPKSFVDSTNKIDTGYEREIAANTGVSMCGKEPEHVDGGINTTAYVGPASKGLKVVVFKYTSTSWKSNPYITNALPLSDGTPAGRIALHAGGTVSGAVDVSVGISSNLDSKAKVEYLKYENNKGESCNISEVASGPTSTYGTPVTFCNGKWKLQVGGDNAGLSGSGSITSSSSLNMGSPCAGINVPAGKAAVRPVLDISFDKVFSISSNPKAGVSDILGGYPAAGSGPYTLQLTDSSLKVKLNSSAEGVTGNTIEVDATEDGKISVPYDIGGSSYDSVGGDIYISAMSGGRYAKLGTATKNGKGSVSLDVNNLVTKTNGKIDTQTISFQLLQEEITVDGYTNYISNPTTVTMKIKALKEDQEAFTISNDALLPYNVEQPNFAITTSGGSGSGAITYALKTDTDGIASISGDTISYSKIGSITITATKAADDAYKEAVAEKTITIEKAKQVLKITNTDFKLGSASNFKIAVEGRASSLVEPLTYALTQGDGVVATLVDDTITPIKAGAIEISVTSKGDEIYEDSTVKKTIQIAEKEVQDPLMITNTDTFPYDKDKPNFKITTSGGSGDGELTYTIKEDTEHVASIANDTITYTKAGSFTVMVSKASDDVYQETTAEKTFTIQKLKQAITITNSDVSFDATSTFTINIDGRESSLTKPLQYDISLGKGEVASISGNTITPLKAGTIELSVTSPGDDIYEDITVKKQIKLTEKANQTPLVITNVDSFDYDVENPSFKITTSGGSGSGEVSYAIKEDVEDVADISSDTITYKKAGSFTITASKASDDAYKESTVEKTFTIKKIKQPLIIKNEDFKIGSASTFAIVVEGKPDTLTEVLQYDLTLGKNAIASISNDIVTPIKAGIIELSVTSVGDDIYEDCTVKKQIELIEKDKQTPLEITNAGTFTYDKEQPSFEITTTGGSGSGKVSYAIKEDSEHVASISDDTITYTKAGTFTITATKAADDTYQESVAEKTIVINKIKQNLTITNEKFIIGSAANFKIDVEGREASLSEEMTYDLTLGKGVVASIAGDVVTPIKAGTIELSATSLGDDIYEDLTISKQIELVEKEEQTPLEITNSDKRVYDKDHLSFDIATSGGSGSGEMTYTIVEDSEHIASISGKSITYTKPGTILVRASKASDGAFKESVAEKRITIEKMKQDDFAITNTDFILSSAATFNVTTIDRPSELSEALVYDISVGKGTIANIANDVITPIKAGNITISVTSKGNDIYEDCTIEKQIAITQLPTQEPALEINNIDHIAYGSNDNALQIVTTGGQGSGAITYEITPSDVASIDATSGLVTIKKVGTFKVTATKAGGSTYSESVASKQFVVEQAQQTDFEITNTDFRFGSAANFAITTKGRPDELSEELVYDVTVGKGDIVTLHEAVITPLKTGSITISVMSKGNDNYEDSTITKQIDITDLPAQDNALEITNGDVTWGQNNNILQIITTGGQGDGVITYELQAGDEDVATINPTTGLVNIKKAGRFQVTASKDGKGTYQDAQAQKTIIVNPMDITITPKPLTKKVNQAWSSISDFGYDVEPALRKGDILIGNAIYAYGSGVNDSSPVGTYDYTISGLSNPNYAITFAKGSLRVEEDQLDGDHAAYYRIKSGTKGLNGWYTSNVVFESLKKDGYDFISDSQTFVGSEFTVSQEGSFTTDIYFKNINGAISKPIQVPLKIDKGAPVMEEIILHEKNSSALAKFINTLSFGNWFKQEIEVELKGSDQVSDVTFMYQEEIDGVLGEWKTTTEPLHYGNGAKLVLHVKAIDEAGNASVDTLASDIIQIDLDAPIIAGIEDQKEYYLPKLVKISDANSGLHLDASYFVNVSQKALHEQTLFNGIGTISLHVEDQAGNIIDAQFSIKGLPPLDGIKDDDASRDIVKEVEKEYEDIKDDLTDEKQKQEIEDWLENAKDKSKKYVDVVEEPESGIIIDGDGSVVFEEDVELVVEVITTQIQNEKIDLEKVEGLDKDDEIKAAYDIYLRKGDEKIQPKGMVKVKIPNTKELQEVKDLKLVYIDDKNAVTLYPSTIDEQYIVFTTDHFSNYAIIGKRSKLNIDVDKDGVLDLNIDSDDDGLPDLNLDIDDDGEADLNIDVNNDGLPDLNIDTTGDGKADVNIDNDGNGVAELNIAQRITKWNPTSNYTVNDFAYDTDATIVGNINVDSDGDGKADTNIDSDGDGIPDTNLDDYWKAQLKKGKDGDNLGGIGGVLSGDNRRWTSWWITILFAGTTMIGSHFLTKKWKITKNRK